MTHAETSTSARHFRLGLLFAVISASTFGVSGPLAKSLMVAGWSPTAAVTARLGFGALGLAVFATAIKRDWVRDALAHAKTIVAYGVVPVAGAQLCYFNAAAHLSVGVALLLEYTSPLLVVGWVWATTRHRPGPLVIAGVGMAFAGITLVLGVLGPDDTLDAHMDLAGVGWGLAAAVCAASYFVMSVAAAVDDDGGASGPHAITLATGGLIVGAVATALLGLADVMPLTFTANDAVIAGRTTSWVVPVVLLATVPTAIAYTFGIMGIARLRPRFASLVGLAEVLFAVLASWALIGEAVTAVQAVGGTIVLAGLALARYGDRSEPVAHATVDDAHSEQTIRRRGSSM